MASESERKILIGIGIKRSDITKLRHDFSTLIQDLGLRHISTAQMKKWQKLDESVKQIKKDFKNAGQITRWFKMELLGVMFGARMVSNAFLGILRPALDMIGFFDIWGTMLGVLFLPTAEMLLDWIIRFFNFVMDLPKPVRELLGDLLLTLGAFFSWIATTAALELFFSSWVKQIGTVTAALGELQKVAKIFITFTLIKDIYEAIKEDKPLDAIVSAMTAATIYTWGIKSVPGGTALALWVTWKWIVPEEIKKDIKEYALILGDYWERYFIIPVLKGINLIIEGLRRVSRGKINITPLDIGPTTKEVIDQLEDFRKKEEEFLKKPGQKFITPPPPYADYKAPLLFPPKQMGGYIPYEGLYHLHAGETVTPANQTMNFSPTITINASGLDARAIANMVKMELNQQWVADLGRLARR